MIVSDFQFPTARRSLGPVMAFIRCDRGSAPAYHHSLTLALGAVPGYVHSAYQVTDLDALATGGVLFDNTVEPGWEPLTASGLAQWGPRVPPEVLGITPSPKLLREMGSGLRGDNDYTLSKLAAMPKGARS
jgi:hypothetical protein